MAGSSSLRGHSRKLKSKRSFPAPTVERSVHGLASQQLGYNMHYLDVTLAVSGKNSPCVLHVEKTYTPSMTWSVHERGVWSYLPPADTADELGQVWLL